MISKVIAWGQDRTAALDTLDEALAGYTALGIDTNVEYLRLLINDADVRAGRLDTGLIERKMPDFSFRHVGDFEVVAAAVFAAAVDEHDTQTAGEGPWHRRDGWRLGAPAPRRISLGTPDGGVATVEVSGAVGQGTATVTVDGGPQRTASLRIPQTQPGRVDPRRRSPGVCARPGVSGTRPSEPGQPDARGAHGALPRQRGLVLPARGAHAARPGSPGCWPPIEREEGAADPAVRSPMPGTVVSVSVSNGDTVEAGQVLLAVEAMKMEHQLVAPLDGTVHISITSGDLVKADQVLATIHPAVPTEPSKAEDTIEEAVIAMGAAE